MSDQYWAEQAKNIVGEYVEWMVGTEVVGTVDSLGEHTFPENERGPARVVPKVTVNVDGHQTEITCGPADLKKKMFAAAPAVGDRIKVECIGETKTAVGMQRFFKVTVARKTNSTAINNPKSTAPIPTTAVDEEAPF